MPKVTFSSDTEFKKWFKNVSETRKYGLYLSINRYQIIAEPQVSSQPVKFGIYNGQVLIEELEKLIKEMAVEFKVPYFIVFDYEFSDSKRI